MKNMMSFFQKKWILCYGTCSDRRGYWRFLVLPDMFQDRVNAIRQRMQQSLRIVQQSTASNEAKLAESEAAVADEMTGYNADLVQKILSMIEKWYIGP